MDSPTIERRKLFQQVAAHLENQILGGRFKPGDLLPPERDLQALFGVGRPAIREALITLQRSGLIEISNGARSRVAVPTASNLVAGVASAVRQMLSEPQGQRSFQDARLFLETGLSRRAARDATEADLARLGAALARNEAAIGDRDLFIATDVGFHFVLAEISRNPVFVALHEAISGWLTEQRVVTLQAPGQEETAFRAHQAIHRAVLARDADAAEAAMAAHLGQLSETYWKRRDASD